MNEIKGLLFDIGGVLYVGDEVIGGASEAISRLKSIYPMRFITNITRRTPELLQDVTELAGRLL